MDILNQNIQAKIQIVENYILKAVAETSKRFTPLSLEKAVSKKYQFGKKNIKLIIRSLIEKKEITYTYKYGCTFLEKSFNRPVRISKYVVLKPHGNQYKQAHEDIVVEIKHGVSFGTGMHPTTRLAVRGIEYALKTNCPPKDRSNNTCLLDIGTGSGVLAITAIKLGINKGTGIDIDPCAIAEARENIRINNLEDKIVISNLQLENIDKRFFMIIANLRYPSIKKMFLRISEITDKPGLVIISGIKADELSDLIDIYTPKNFIVIWKKIENHWAGIVFSKV